MTKQQPRRTICVTILIDNYNTWTFHYVSETNLCNLKSKYSNLDLNNSIKKRAKTVSSSHYFPIQDLRLYLSLFLLSVVYIIVVTILLPITNRSYATDFVLHVLRTLINIIATSSFAFWAYHISFKRGLKFVWVCGLMVFLDLK